MKIYIILFSLGVALAMGVSGCGGGNRELEADAKNFADAMCRNLETMQKLRGVNPADSIQVEKLQQERQKIDHEMSLLAGAFKKKYGEKANTPEFGREYRKYLSEAMLECKFLTSEDRANFERELN